jgi:hypothetical protein
VGALTIGGGSTTATNVQVSGGVNSEILTLTQSTGQSMGMYAGTATPGFTADAGSLYLQDDNTTGALWINNSSGGSGTSWTQVQTGAEALTLQGAYNNGNSITTASTTDILFNLSAAGGGFTVSGNGAVDFGSTGTDVAGFAVGTSTFDIDATGAVTVDSTGGGISLDAANASNFTTTGSLQDLTLKSTLGSVVIEGGQAASDSIRLNTTNVAGGIDIDAGTDGIDIDTTGNININSTGAGGTDIIMDAFFGVISLTGGKAAANAIELQTTDAAGGIDIDSGTAGIAMDSTGAISLDGVGASNFTTASGNLTLSTTTTGEVLIDGRDGVEINSVAGAIDIGNDANAFAINIGTGAAARTITMGNATGATAVDIDSGTGGVTIDSTGSVSIDGTGASNVSATSGNLTVSTITSGNVVIDSAGGIDGDANGTITFDHDARTAASGSAGWDGSWTAGTGGTGVAQVGPIAAGAGGDLDFTGGAGGQGLGGAGAGEGSDAGLGGNVNITGGTGGTSDGSLFADPAVPADGGNIVLTGGTGGAGAAVSAGDGGDVTITGGTSGDRQLGTAGNGGSVTIDAGASFDIGSPGTITIGGTNTLATEIQVSGGVNTEILTLTQSTGQSMGMYAGTATPSFTADTGSLYFQDTGTTGALWVNESTGGSGTTWVQVQTGAGDSSLQDAYNNGNTIVTASSTDIAFTLTSGDFTVDGGGEVDFGGTTRLSNFSVLTAASSTITLDGAASSIINIGTNTGANQTINIGDDTLGTALNLQAGTNGIAADTTGAISLDGAAASNFSTTTGDITVSTASGDAIISSSADVQLDTGSAGEVTDGGRLNANVTIADGDVVYIVDAAGTARYALADASADSTARIVGFASNAATAGNPVNLAGFPGQIVKVSSTLTTIGAKVYLSETAGAVTQTAPPTSGAFVIEIGYVVTTGVGTSSIMYLGMVDIQQNA